MIDRSETISWMSWWNWLRLPPSSPYQFLRPIEAWQRLWSLDRRDANHLVDVGERPVEERTSCSISLAFPVCSDILKALESGR